jgi:hypothetical protein
MNRLRLFSLLTAIAAVFAVAVAMVSSASGATMTLPNFSKVTNGTSTSGPGTLFGAEEITCKKDKGLTGGISNTLGTYDLTFEECTSLGKNCRSLGQAVGANTIATTGQYHLLLTGGQDGGSTHEYLLWFLVAELHLECEILGTQLIVVKGNVLGSITAESETKFAIAVDGTKGGQEISSYENNNGEAVAAGGLESNVNEGAFSKSFENSPGSLITENKTKLEN